MSIIRKRTALHKSQIPNNTKENQYILAEFQVTDTLIELFNHTDNSHDQPYHHVYQTLADLLFELCRSMDLKNCQFIANDKLPRVRFSQEMHQWQTNQQILFYYNPSSHELNKTFFDGSIRAEKITLLFLASGLDIRDHASQLHNKVKRVLSLYSQKLSLPSQAIRLRDHQHITYDLYAKYKGCDINRSHKLIPLANRYQDQSVQLDAELSETTFAIANIPITNYLLNLVNVNLDCHDPYNPLYTFVADALAQALKRYNLNNGTMIANGLVPIVRGSEFDESYVKGELQILGFSTNSTPYGMICKWDASELVNDIQLIFIASKDHCSEHGYGKFLNHVEQALKLITTELEIAPTKEEITLRFHQHLAYNL